ncbi:hypothetical protein [Streptomyces luteireticuli]|uniref:hypothetical protein n=1 Tax=Streptomyces luteireticuli TaxID=173858 RepID=UPI0035586928
MPRTASAPAWPEACRLRRRFAVAAWGLALPVAGGAAAAAIAAAMVHNDIASLVLVGNAAVMARAAYACVSRVRAVRSRVVGSAAALLLAAAGRGGDLRRAAEDFELCMVGARSAAGLRILPKKAAEAFGRDVVREAEHGELTTGTLSRVSLVERAVHDGQRAADGCAGGVVEGL